MANNKPADSLDTLQFMLNDVIVQIGKALKASNKQPGRRNVAQVQTSLQNHMPNAIDNFHWALDDLEVEITRAKGALQRDLDRCKVKAAPRNGTALTAQPDSKEDGAMVPTQPAQPSTSGEANESSNPATQTSAPVKAPLDSPAPPVAPMPNMGLGAMPTPVQTETIVKQESAPSAPQAVMGPVGGDAPSAEQQPAAPSQTSNQPTSNQPPVPAAPPAPMDDILDLGGPAEGSGDGAGEFNFTDMTFSLAPANGDAANPSATQQPDMSMADFGNDGMNLDDFLPMENPAHQQQPAPPQPPQPPQQQQQQPPAAAPPVAPATAPTPTTAAAPQGKAENNDKPANQGSDDLEDMFNFTEDGGGMDLDMNLGNGADVNNFENMFFADLGGGDLGMEEGKFDDAYFGLSK